MTRPPLAHPPKARVLPALPRDSRFHPTPCQHHGGAYATHSTHASHLSPLMHFHRGRTLNETGDEWGSFDDDDWLGKSSKEGTGGSGGGAEEEVEALLRPRGAGTGESVPGLLGGARFGKNLAAEPDDGEGEEGIVDEVRDEATRSAGRRR